MTALRSFCQCRSGLSCGTVKVLIATPLGKGGKGGIDRLMDELRTVLAQEPVPDISVAFGTTRGQGHIMLSPIYLLGFVVRMIYLRSRGRLDLLHLNLSSYGSTWRKLMLARVANILGIPYVIHLHSGKYQDFWQAAPKFCRQAIRHMFSRAALIIVLGKVWRDFVLGKVPEVRERIIILPNATRRPVAIPHRGDEDAVVILFLGRLVKSKGVPQLIDALKCLDSIPSWRAVIAGDGDVVGAQARIEELGLKERVQLPGWVGPDEVETLLTSADILVLPSFYENLPMALIEGMAAGLALVATPVGSVEDILADGETALFVPPGDVAALANALRQLILDAALRQRLGKAALNFYSRNLEIGGYVNALAAIWRDSVK